ncbi:hypothetical protein QBC47DRAFT_413299 [Echria macrotheca]|uniref:Rhodopsin domain-containing protein n=1 Tax=Echria macrotheca TaxID=438768 RepID=A0AAJ0BC31_9PEZI|nr:hypothetical protein QBC47DRAFT_413299 [Echria macrotheca]
MSATDAAPPPPQQSAGPFGAPSGGNGTSAPPPPFDPSQIQFLPVSAEMAYLSRVFIGVTSVLLFFCIITFVTRMYQRIRPVWKVGWDDYFIVLGFCLSVIDWSFLMMQQNPTEVLVPIELSVYQAKYGWIAIGIWGLSMTCLKVSIALTLLRIQQKSLAWRIFLFSIIGLQVAYGILNVFFNLVISCRPLAKAWDFRMTDGYCVPSDVMRAASNTGSGVNIVTDVLLSLAPAVFLRKLNRPLRERIFICFLMGLGLIASAWSIVKTVLVQKFYDPNLPQEELIPVGIAISTYTVLEQMTGILAACIPAMKNIFQACLGRMGVSLSDSRSRPGRSGYYAGGSNAAKGTVPSNPFRSAAGTKLDSVDDDEEKCLEMPEMRRGASTPKSSGTGSGSFREENYSKGHVVTTVHAV